MRGNASILWATPPKVEVLAAPDSDLSFVEVPAGEWNGPIYRVVEFSSTEFKVAPSTYGHLSAARRGEDSSEPLFLAVTGVTRIDAGFVLGKRGGNVTDSGVWEFAPAGGVQELPVEQQILNEANEELSLSPEEVTVGHPKGLYVDYSAFTADLVIPLKVNLTASDFQANFVPGEYEELSIVNADELRAFLQRNSPSVACVTEFILTLIESGSLTSPVQSG